MFLVHAKKTRLMNIIVYIYKLNLLKLLMNRNLEVIAIAYINYIYRLFDTLLFIETIKKTLLPFQTYDFTENIIAIYLFPPQVFIKGTGSYLCICVWTYSLAYHYSITTLRRPAYNLYSESKLLKIYFMYMFSLLNR